MSLLNSSKYQIGIEIVRMHALNPDLTVPKVTRIVGGIGPFDLSGVSAIGAIPFTSKFDDGTAEDKTADLSGAADQTAVTVDEIFAAINTATPTNITASKESSTNRLMLAATVPGTLEYFQFYGELAEVTDIGQGLGVKFIKSDTLVTADESPIRKDDESITIVDAKGRETELLTDGYRKGVTYTLNDSANDYEMKELIEGGVIDSDGGYTPPNINSVRRYFYMEIFAPTYREGTSNERDKTGYIQLKVYQNKGTFGDVSRGRAWAAWTFPITALAFEDETETFISDSKEIPLTNEEFEALDVYNV